MYIYIGLTRCVRRASRVVLSVGLTRGVRVTTPHGATTIISWPRVSHRHMIPLAHTWNVCGTHISHTDTDTHRRDDTGDRGVCGLGLREEKSSARLRRSGSQD